MMTGFKHSIIALFLCVATVHGQVVKQGIITFERKTNLLKKFDDERMRNFIKEDNKIKIDKFSLVFNDTASLFSYIQPDEQDRMSWLTVKNTVYQNLKREQRTVFMDMWGTSLILSDSAVNHQWKITDKTRKIAGYECIRAIWQKDDSTRIYAWFTTDIAPSIGPESVTGLPGAVLGLATEDGGVVYFATKVELIEPKVEQIAKPKKKGKEYTEQALKIELTEKLQGEPFGPRIIKELFFW
jgi:GLPGLI family protein